MIVPLVSLLALASLGDGSQIANGDFEAKGVRNDPVPGWALTVGARNGGEAPLSRVSVDKKVKHSGKASLHFAADRKTYAFQIVTQEIEARPGGTYQLTGFARTKNARHEVNAKGINQFNNCYIAIFLKDGNGEVVARDIRTPTKPYTDDWESLALQVMAPATVRQAAVTMFLSISGDLWFDDLELSIEGGDAIPPPATVFHEDFDSASELPPTWLVEEGAQNGGTSPVSKIELDGRKRSGKTGASLQLSGDERTLLWQSVNRYFEAAPGDTFVLRAMVSAEKVRAEENVRGIQQFQNLHLRLVFFDEAGKTVGAPQFAHPGFGNYDWKPVAIRTVAPEGAARGMAGIFLSVSGDVWIDDIELTRQPGGAPAYEGWKSLETRHLVLRFAPDHPRAGDMQGLGERFEEALAHIAATLEVPVEEPITVFLYRDGPQGEALTGRPLAYAEPERRAVHQDPTNTLGHELAHVVALPMGYSQTGLLGEGIAVWLDGSSADHHHGRAAELLRTGELPTMAALLDDFRGQSQGYPAAGSFCGWLLETHGLDALRRMYPRKDLRAAAPAVVGQSLDELDGAWRAFLGARE